jgi:hypothetical protein
MPPSGAGKLAERAEYAGHQGGVDEIGLAVRHDVDGAFSVDDEAGGEHASELEDFVRVRLDSTGECACCATPALTILKGP